MNYEDFVPLRNAKADSDIGRFLKNRDTLYWQIRNRKVNGLEFAHAVTKAPDGEWWINKPAYFRWFVRDLEGIDEG
ncbi:MAG: hypothetical protein HN738_15820 [Gammaproteobacteria bacterium]|jgi:hypothetical protein|nr:hypothetical protein [Acidiferrobacteraceae bacterium]MBT7879542.1 hypothetical protein [Gammaproteobacteria bacterium]